MTKFEKQTIEQKAFERLVSDPFAPESQWLPACAELSQIECNRSSNIAGRFETISFALPLSIVASCLVSGAFTCIVQMGYDLGYRLIELIFGQTSGSQQGMMALQTLIYAVAPVTFGLSFGAFKSRLQGSRKAWSFLGFLAPCLFAVVMSCLSHDQGNSDDIWIQCLWIGVATSLDVLSISFAEKFVNYLGSRMRITSLLLTGTVALAPLVLMSHFIQLAPFRSQELILAAEIALYLACLFIPAFYGAACTKVNDKIGALFAGSLVVLPLILCNFLNVGGNLLSLALDTVGAGAHLSWHALASALALSTLSFVALIGASLAWKQPELGVSALTPSIACTSQK